MANTLPTLPDLVADLSITTLGTKLSSVDCFATEMYDQLVDPLRPIGIPVTTGAASSETGITNFENETNSDSTKILATVTPVHVTQRFKLTNTELNSGHKLESLIKKNLQSFANGVMDQVLAPLTVANYGAAHIAATPADLDVADLKTLWGEASNFEEKNVILDGSYYANFLSGNRDEYRPQDGVYGFDKFRYNNRWNGAEANVVGVVCDPSAVAVAAALPEMTEEVREKLTNYEVIELPNGISALFTTWASTGSRQTWAMFEVMVGSQLVDASAAKLIKTA